VLKSGEEARHRRVEVGRGRVDETIQLRTSPVVRGVGDQLHPLAGLEAGQAETSRADAASRDVGGLHLACRRIGEDVLRNDQDLVDQIEELLGGVPPEVGDHRERVAHGDRIDVRDERQVGRAEGRILHERHAVADVARAHGASVVPPRTRIQMEHDRQGVRRPLPAVGELLPEAPIAHRVQVVADLGEPIVQEIRDLPLDAARHEARIQRPGLGRQGDHHGAADVVRTGRNGLLRITACSERQTGERDERPSCGVRPKPSRRAVHDRRERGGRVNDETAPTHGQARSGHESSSPPRPRVVAIARQHVVRVACELGLDVE
jgi:hypothetical protein